MKLSHLILTLALGFMMSACTNFKEFMADSETETVHELESVELQASELKSESSYPQNENLDAFIERIHMTLLERAINEESFLAIRSKYSPEEGLGCKAVAQTILDSELNFLKREARNPEATSAQESYLHRLYLGLLDRQPDDESFLTQITLIATEKITIEEVEASFLDSEEFKSYCQELELEY